MAKKAAPRPRRTREHVIASQSYNFIETFFIDKGHTVARPAEDYGFDLLINTFDDDGYAENGEILIQLKASDGFVYSKYKEHIPHQISIEHYNLWTHEPMPVFLVLYHARVQQAHWLFVQEYFRLNPARRPRRNAARITLRVPVTNQFMPATVDYAREQKAIVLAQIAERINHGG